MIVQSVTELERIQNKLENEVSFVAPIFVDQNLHCSVNELSSLHILFNDEYVCIPYNHPDAVPLSIDMTVAKKIVSLYKREILHAFPTLDQTKVYDVATQLHLTATTTPDIREYYTPVIQRTLKQFEFKNLHLSIPLVVWMDYAHRLLQLVKEKYSSISTEGFEFINNTVIPTLSSIEQSGVYVDTSVLNNHFGENINRYVKNNNIYTEYNPYTSTGRPSNTYGGVNFAALHKTDGTRKAFTSRYGSDGILIQFDYEAFHLRLVAKQMGYTLPQTSVHKYLAEQYYGTQHITTEQYELSKQRTFALMYGMSEDFGNIEFFHKVRNYSNNLWKIYEDVGYVVSQTGKFIRMDTPSCNKVFNYMVQSMETEESLTCISRVCNLLRGHLTKPILYTYDALLLDVHRAEAAILPRIRYLLEEGGYPVRMYKGKNYNELISI